MDTVIITIAGISSRFNEGIPENRKVLKAIYNEGDYRNTLLYHLLLKCSSADRIILVGGYKFESLNEYLLILSKQLRDKITVVYNDHFEDLGSGYSLYMGLVEAFNSDSDEIIFVEGDLDIDNESFERVAETPGSVLTYTHEPIYANKAVVLYKNDKDNYRYAFNSDHGLLSIDESFSCILNSGQMWKFTEIDKLREANTRFYDEAMEDTNLRIIQNYLDQCVDVDVVPLKRWTNCNTRDDYRRIVSYWEEEQ